MFALRAYSAIELYKFKYETRKPGLVSDDFNLFSEFHLMALSWNTTGEMDTLENAVEGFRLFRVVRAFIQVTGWRESATAK